MWLLDGHHGDHAASYLTQDAQFHAGTVGNFAGRATVAGVLAGIVAAIPDLHANVQDIFGAPIVSGTYPGGPIGIPMNGVTPPQPIGGTPQPPIKTAPNFDAFVVTSGP